MSDQSHAGALPNTQRPQPSIGRFLRDVVETLILAALIFVGIRSLVRNFWIEGSSMEPNLHHDQYLLVAKFSYWFSPPRRGDIVVFESPLTPGRDLIKRVVGLPGEQVVIENAQVLVNGQPLKEPYAYPMASRGGPWKLKDDQVFVLGDNRNFSQDSRSWGPLSIGQIVGKAWFCYWPPSTWGEMPHYDFKSQQAEQSRRTG